MENMNFNTSPNPNVNSSVNTNINQPTNQSVSKPVKKKKKGVFKKVMALVLSGVLLGSVAGVTFYGTTAIANHIDPFAKVLAAMGVLDEEVSDKISENLGKENEGMGTVPTLQTGTQGIITITDISEISK